MIGRRNLLLGAAAAIAAPALPPMLDEVPTYAHYEDDVFSIYPFKGWKIWTYDCELRLWSWADMETGAAIASNLESPLVPV